MPKVRTKKQLRSTKEIINDTSEEVTMSEFKVGQKVHIKDGTIPGKYAGTTQEIASVDTGFFMTVPYGYRMKGLPESEGGTENIWKGEELEPVKTKFNVGDKVKFKVDLHPGEWWSRATVGSKGIIEHSHNVSLGDGDGGYKGKLMFGVSFNGSNMDYSPEELELVREEKTMDYKEALKLAIDGHKITSDIFEQPYYIYFDVTEGKFMVSNVGATYELEYNISSQKWKLYVKPKVQPKFPIGSTVIYRSNRHATVVDVKEAHGAFEYVLNADKDKPRCTFVKGEGELEEVR